VNYIDEIARAICLIANRSLGGDSDFPLYRIYAVLALSTGTETTNENVHDAWAAWTAGRTDSHPCLVPYGELSPEAQELDTLYMLAIRTVATQLKNERRLPQ
jgi:hypothetical protein